MQFVLLGVIIVGGIVALVMFLPKGVPSTDTGIGGIRSGRDLPTYTTFGEDVYESEQFKQLRNYLDGSPTSTNLNTNTGGNPNPFRAQ